MAKIHTHYDNLKVARMAPQEVIRAAYKALSQKYHPDKNPGDDKAARIMAIVNTAYGILSDPMRRKEHDEWIAAEEWEIAWLESTNDDIARHRVSGVSSAWEAPAAAPARPLLRQPAVWMTLTAVFAAGLAAGALFPSAPRVVRMVRAPAPAPVPVLPVAAPAAPVAARTIPDDFAARPDPASAASAPSLKTLAVTELAVPARGADCSTEIRTTTAPNGSPWPERSGYIDGYALVNQGPHMRIEVSNAVNDSPVLVRVVDLERAANVRHAYILPHESFTIDKLVAGRYQVRYQNVDPGGERGDCAQALKQALKQAAAAP